MIEDMLSQLFLEMEGNGIQNERMQISRFLEWNIWLKKQ